MNTVSLAPRTVTAPLRRRRVPVDPPVRDPFAIWRRRPYGLRLLARAATLGLAVLAAADVIDDSTSLRLATLIAAALLAGGASLLAIAAAEFAGVDQSRRWRLQAVASAVVMFMLMANTTAGTAGDP